LDSWFVSVSVAAGIVAETRGVGRLALGEDLLLDLADLLFEALDPLFR
jgi:hypothetical protein